MADYTNSRLAHGAMHPQNAIESTWARLEPLISPGELVFRKLFGIPLVSGWSLTPRLPPQKITDDMLKDVIRRMVNRLEAESKIVIMPTKFLERKAFDRQEFDSFGYLQLNNRPVSSVDKLAIQDTSLNDIFVMPSAWISAAYFTRGRINIIPLSPAQTSATFSAMTGTGGSFGSSTLAVLSLPGNIPAYWTVEYTAGFPEGQVPAIANELVSIMAAMEVISLLAPTYARGGSHSLGIDGLSQSISNPGAELFKVRMEELEKEREKAMKTWKGIFGRNMLVSAL